MTSTTPTRLSRRLVSSATISLATFALVAGSLNAQTPPDISKKKPKQPVLEFAMMTWPEVREALAAGKTTALVYTGGTEQRGPQNVNGGHTLMGEKIAQGIAERLGNAIWLPVLPYSPNNASASLPGTIGLTNEIMQALLERISEQAIATGFKNVVVMGDHGGGQGDGAGNVYAATARKLDEKYAPKGIHVFYCDRVYAPAQDDFSRKVAEKGLPPSSHAGLPDTAEMLYLGNGDWSRVDLYPIAFSPPAPPPGTPRDPNAPRVVGNGISGDARQSTKEWGKLQYDMKIDYAVKQIEQWIPRPAGK
ncbi:MAG: creatininase family protein [Gemmatimonas sp.]